MPTGCARLRTMAQRSTPLESAGRVPVPDGHIITDREGVIVEADQTASSMLGQQIETEELRASEAQLRALFDTAPVGIVLCDVDGVISFSNQAVDRLLEGRPGATNIRDRLTGACRQDRVAVQRMLAEVSRGGPTLSMRYRIDNEDAPTRWIDHTATAFRDPAGELEGTLSTLIDATLEVEAAEGLRSSQGFAEALLDTVGALVLVFDTDRRVQRFNRECEVVTGLSADEVIGKDFLEFLVPFEQRARVDEMFAALLTDGIPKSMENDWINNEGRRRRINWHNSVITDDQDHVVAVIATGIDVTHQRLLEGRLAQSDRLESVGRLAAGVAHDFNNTLAVLELRIGRVAVTDDAQRENVEALTRALDQSRATIADLLSFSRHQELSLQATAVNAAVERLAAVAVDMVSGEGIEVVLDLTEHDSTALVDPGRLEQIVVNLVVNASDAMAEGGVLTLRTSIGEVSDDGPADIHLATLGSLTPGRYLCLTVADTGSGIESDVLAHVFEPYFTTKPPGRGTGLGLATAYGIVVQSGGAIAVHSEPGRGSSFTLWLPQPSPSDR